MSDPVMWRDKMDFHRRDQVGVDPVTHLPTHTSSQVLDDELCDFAIVSRRRGQQGPGGTVYNTVKEPIVKVWPDDPSTVPDENDHIVVNGKQYRVVQAEHSQDGASGEYRGSRLTLSAPEET